MPHFFSRADAQSAARAFAAIFADEATRRLAMEILAASLLAAHAANGQSWGVTLDKNAVRLNVGRGVALSFSRQKVVFCLDNGALEEPECRVLQAQARIENGFSRLAPHASRVGFTPAQLGELWPLIEHAHLPYVRQAARGFESRAPRPATIRDAHSSGVLQCLRAELNREIPDPAYVPAAPPAAPAQPQFDAAQFLLAAMQSGGLGFPPTHLAAFFTALAAKGLVILSGPSGVGKTALALRFAALLPQIDEARSDFRLEPEHGEIGLPLSESLSRYLACPRAGERRAATLVCEGAAFPIHIAGTASGPRLQLRGAARKWCAQNVGALVTLERDFEADAARPAFRLLLAPQSASEGGANHLFLPVRPDWRDEKALLGYFNPLANRYEWTPFLRFLLRADAGFARSDGLAYFVILDEMNLARAEWYFADFLSLLEAGRDETGRTREPLRFDFEARATGELPPRELRLPPNLYFVGTINADESAPSLSPKVLDRAWVLEAPRADFRVYGAAQTPDWSASDAQKQALSALFTRGGHFAVADKNRVAAQLENHPARREDLAVLGEALEPLGAGFGFRAFDEILLFCALAGENGLFASETEAFDCAVSLKIGSRFRGARGVLDEALRVFSAWSQARELKQCVAAAQKLLVRLERDGFLP